MTVETYLLSLPEDRREAISAVREVILRNLPEGFEEGVQYGMIGYFVPHSLYPKGYHCDPKKPLSLAILGSESKHMALHLMAAYGNEELRNWFEEEYRKSGKKLDMGKACLRFKKLEDLPLDVIGELFTKISVERYVAVCEAAIQGRGKK